MKLWVALLSGEKVGCYWATWLVCQAALEVSLDDTVRSVRAAAQKALQRLSESGLQALWMPFG